MEWDQLLNKERRRTSTNPGDHREEFERDYDRSVFSSPVKRLQDKAQVFPLEPHDSVRTRLTHSLEVASVARGIVRKLCSGFLSEKLEPGQDRQIEAIASTCGLLHDLGNPPFGHSGEDAIQEWFRKSFPGDKLRKLLTAADNSAAKDAWVKDFDLFEGNAQTLRLVSKLQILADYEGLNLTYGTLSALCKYTAHSLEAGDLEDHSKSKMGYFSSEADLVDDIRSRTGTGDARNPITFLVEAADDTVYSVADIEDGVKKSVLSWATLEQLLLAAPAEAQPSVTKTMEIKHRILNPSITSGAEIPDDVHAAAFRTAAITVLVGGATASFETNYTAIMDGTFQGELLIASDVGPFSELLKDIGRKRIYCTSSNLKLELMGRRVIQDLMTLFWEGASDLTIDGKVKPKNFKGKIQSLLSPTYRQVFCHSATESTTLPINYHRLQLVTDYVCGMTDTYAKTLHSELMNG